MKKIACFWISFLFCNLIFGQNKLCLTENFEKLGKIPKSISRNYESKEIFEGYQFCGTKVSGESKGIYYVYRGNAAAVSSKTDIKPYISQLIYVSPDSKNYEDLLYITDEDYYIPQISIKKIYGRDYIKFDDYGTAFINVTRFSTKESGILMFSPVNKTKTFFALPQEFSSAADFDISRDGRFMVVNAYNGGTNYSHQAFLYNTEEADAEPQALLYMLSEELSSVVFYPETQAFYMMVAFYDTTKPIEDCCGFVVLRPEKQTYSKDSAHFYNRNLVTEGENRDFWFNIFLLNESDKNLYAVNHKDSYDGSVYKIIDRQDYIETENIHNAHFINIRNSRPPLYKISMKSTPFGLYLKDKDDNVYLYKDNQVIYAHDEEINQELQSYYESLIELVPSSVPEPPKENHKNWILILLITVSFLLICLICILIILIHSRKKNQQKLLQKKILAFQESERAKLSRDIHDSVVQDIRAIRLQTEMIDVGENPASITQKNRTIDDITQSIVKMRNICYNLTPAELMTHKENDSSEIELISVYDSLCQQFYVKSKIPCKMQIAENLVYPKYSKEVTLHLIRIFQEILNNIEKHSYATNVNVLVRNQTENNEHYLIIFVIDDGIGCNIEQILKNRKKNHFGLSNMQERMQLIDGKIEFFSSENEGMKIKLTIKM